MDKLSNHWIQEEAVPVGSRLISTIRCNNKERQGTIL